MSVKLSSINKLLKEWEKSDAGKKRIKETVGELREGGVGKTAGGSEILTKEGMEKLAKEFIDTLTMKANTYAGQGDGSIPPSVLAHFASLYYEGPFEEKDGSYSVLIKFRDDPTRQSLDPDRYGTDGVNIVALFNNGLGAKNYASGWWEGHEPTGAESIYRSGVGTKAAYIRSTKDRQGLHFIQSAIKDFEEAYSKKYGASAIPNEIYTYEPGGYPG